MSGRYLLDTNTFIYAINRKLALPSNFYAASVITKMELLSWPSLEDEDEIQLRSVLQSLAIIELSESIQDVAIKIRRNTSLKLPDSIISATAITGEFTLVTDDDKLRKRHVGKAISLEELLSKPPL